MKLFTTGSKLSATTTWVTKISNARTPTLAGVLISAKDETTFSATNRDTFGTANLASTVVEPGRLLVSGQGLALVTSQLEARDDVTLVHDGSQLVIKRGRTRWTLPEMPADFLPSMPRLGVELGRIPGEVLKDGLSKVLPALADSVDSYELTALTGVEFTLDGTLTLTTTDRYRIATVELEWKSACEPRALVVPGALLSIPMSILSGEVTLHSDGNLFGVRTETHETMGRLVANPFLNWRNALSVPSFTRTVATVGTAELLAAVKSVSILSVVDGSHRGDLVELRFTEDSLELQAHNQDHGRGKKGESEDAVGLEGFSGEPAAVFCQHPYLVDALKAVDTENVVISVAEDIGPRPGPVLLQPTEGNYRHVLMPINHVARKAT